MSDIHSCSYYCNRPACIKAQRDEMRERIAVLAGALEDLRGEPTFAQLKAGAEECDPPRTAAARDVPLQDIYRAMIAAAGSKT